MMRMPLFRNASMILIAAVSFLLAGCLGKSPSPRFYALTPMASEQEAAGQGNTVRNPVIGIGPVSLADYLDQPKIVTRQGDHQMVRAEYDQWAGAFKDNVTSVLAENIGFLLPTDKMYHYPWRRSIPVDFQVVLDIVRCDGILGKEAWMVARWSVFDGRDKRLVGASRASIREPVTDGGYAALVAAYSRALAELSREIVAAIHDQGPGKK